MQVEIKGDPENWDSDCKCARGKAWTCAHRAALLIKAYKTFSCTSIPCQWSKKKSPDDGKIHTLKSLSNRQVVRPAYPPVDPAVFERLKKDLEECPDEAGAGVRFLLEEEPELPDPMETTITPTRVPDAFTVIKDHDSTEAILARLKISWEDIKLVAERTTGQASNSEWARIRLCRLTASKFGDILKVMMKPRPSPPASLLEGLLKHKKLDGVRALLWGRTHEKVALKKFTEVTGKTVQLTGIWLHESGFLGGSPDGLIVEDTTIEVKCPYSLRTKVLEEALQEKKSEQYIIFRRDGQWLLNTNNHYFHQIQGCLHLTKREKCILFLWTPQSYVAFTIMKEPGWAANIGILERFYIDFFVPYVRNQML